MCKQNLRPGVAVILEEPYIENGVPYNKGSLRNSMDGEYWYIRIPILPDECVIVERYFTTLRTE